MPGFWFRERHRSLLVELRSFGAPALLLAVFTDVPRSSHVLGSPHSPGPTPMAVPDLDWLPSGISQLLYASL